MLDHLKDAANQTRTENGAATHTTTYSDCLDLFATVGGLRRAPDQEIETRFMRAFCENRDLAMKILFFTRDVRGGLGERRIFRTAAKWLALNEPESLRKNLTFFAEYGRWDDLLILLNTPCERDAISLIQARLTQDLTAQSNNEPVSLLAKWLPSVNASNAVTVAQAKRIAKALHMKDADYRKTLVKLRASIRILENNLREKDYTFDYDKQCSKALLKYRDAFLRNDQERYRDFLAQVSSGEKTMHTGTLTPYEIIAPLVTRYRAPLPGAAERQAMDVTWNAQEDFTNGENALVVIDGSGSMYGGSEPLPAAVALSLGIYFAERNTGAFQNHFITFSERPQLVEIKGKDICEKVMYCEQFNEIADTNLQRVFELILHTALTHQVPQEEMPSTLYIISDMEFNYCTRDASMTNFEYAKRIFEEYGYQLPHVVFWNVDSRNRQQPVTMNEQGVALVSGISPHIFSMLAGGRLTPYDSMLDILNSERYRNIAA